MVQQLNPGKHLLLLVVIQKFDHLIIPFETDCLNSFELISEDFQKYLMMQAYIKPSCQTLSKALDKSRKTARTSREGLQLKAE